MQTARLMCSSNIKKILSVIITASLVAFSSYCYSDEKEDETISKIRIPPGMMIKKVGNFYILTAKDADVRREGNFGQIISPEGPEEYSARKMEDVEARFTKDEAEIEALKKDVAELKKALKAADRQ
ncbi:MAG: hypothetical protein WC779_05130 [Candidatus Omnitrophota bacterium]